MVDATHTTHYERFREEKLSALASQRVEVAAGIASPMAQFESQKVSMPRPLTVTS